MRKLGRTSGQVCRQVLDGGIQRCGPITLPEVSTQLHAFVIALYLRCVSASHTCKIGSKARGARLCDCLEMMPDVHSTNESVHVQVH